MRFVRLNHKTKKKKFQSVKVQKKYPDWELIVTKRPREKNYDLSSNSFQCSYVYTRVHTFTGDSTHCMCSLNSSSVFNLPVHQPFFCCDYAAISLFSIQTPLLKGLKIISTKPDFGVHLLALNISSPLWIRRWLMTTNRLDCAKMLY